MAQYKVPQDVEADDKLLGPFSPRQVLYLFIAVGFCGVGYLLIQLLPVLVILVIPFVLFFGALALPIRKDQPMETYFAALLSFYTKPKKRLWAPGQRESTIQITAPKIVEGPRIRNIDSNEANTRLSFLAEIVDSEGRAIKTSWNSPVKEEYVAEADSTPDIFETYQSQALNRNIASKSAEQHAAAVDQMRAAFAQNDFSTIQPNTPTISHDFSSAEPDATTSVFSAAAPVSVNATPTPDPARTAAMDALAHNPDYTVETIAKEANRIQKSNDNEIFISLH